jgi:methionine sulfoxide reductase heme-binding subunit
MPITSLPSRAAALGSAAQPVAHDSALSALHHTAATAGFLAYGLMVGTVCWGILTTTHLARRGIRRQTLYGGHMTMAIMTISFIVVHIAGNIFSPAVALGPLNAIIPFFPGNSLGVTMGVVGTELAIAIAASVWFQRRLGYRTWHVIHWLAYPAYVLSIAHTWVTGSDVHAPLVATALSASLLSVVALFVLRALPATSLVRTRFAPSEY